MYRFTDPQIETFSPILDMASAILNDDFAEVMLLLHQLKAKHQSLPKEPKRLYDQAIHALTYSMSCDFDYHAFINRYLLADSFMVSNFMDQFIDAAFGNQSYKFLDDILDIESVTVERLQLLRRYKEFCLPVVLESATHKSYTNNSALYIPPGYYTYPILMVLLERRITRDFLIEHIYDMFDVMSDILSEPQMRDLKFECNKYVMYETIKRL